MSENNDFGSELAAVSVGCRLAFRWVGNSKAVDDIQNAEAAALFGASAEAVKTSKRLFDNDRPEWRAVQAIRGRMLRFWKLETLPYTDRGVRLLRRDNAAAFAAAFDQLAAELAEAVQALNAVFSELLAENRQRLGNLFNAADYPATLIGEFSAAVDFPNLTPPDYIAQLSPELFERERRRIASQFDRAVELAESAFLEEFGGMIDRIVGTLQLGENGKPLIFRDSMIENVRDFAARFRRLDIGNNAKLSELVQRAEALANATTPQQLRSIDSIRQQFRDQFAAVGDQLAAATIARPGRVLKLKPAATPPATEPAAETVQAEPATPPATEPAAETVQTEPATPPATEPAAETVQAEPAKIVFQFNYGGGRVESIAIPNRDRGGVAVAG